MELAIPGEAPAVQYELEIGFYDWQTMERLSILDSNGRPAADHAILTELRISPQS